MKIHRPNSERGFSLLELVITLIVAGLPGGHVVHLFRKRHHQERGAPGVNGFTLLDNVTLADNVSDFFMKYYKSLDDADPQTVWTLSHRIIEFTLEVTGPGGASRSFTGRVVPRNL